MMKVFEFNNDVVSTGANRSEIRDHVVVNAGKINVQSQFDINEFDQSKPCPDQYHVVHDNFQQNLSDATIGRRGDNPAP